MPDAAHPLNLTGHALSPGAQRSWWLREALDHEDARPCPPLAADAKADVVVVGGGFSGLWTAYFLTERDPNLGVVVLEQDICGGGPSGRNGGFASGWWDELHGLITLYGRDQAVKACRAISSSITALGEFCKRHDIDAWFRRGGYMYAITAGSHARRESSSAACRARRERMGRRVASAQPAAGRVEQLHRAYRTCAWADQGDRLDGR
ncbi:MAG: FAD-dependent oxidoreductase [Chloroflexi bacterium]|nr:MAG: FAD-dependent oxidoreductase [Chloroflexota bacterium]